MTSRTIDIKCSECRKYLFSIMPHDPDNKDHWCSEACEIIGKLKGPPEDGPPFDIKAALATLSFRKKKKNGPTYP